MPADSSASSNNTSPPSPVTATDGVVSSPQSRRTLTSPWAQVVRGAAAAEATAPRSPSSSPSLPEQVDKRSPPPENDVSDTKPESSSDSTNDSRPIKPAWNKPLSNGVVVEAAGSFMGGSVAWPALSECTSRSSPKSSSKLISDGSSTTLSQGPTSSKLPQKQANASNSHSNANHTMPARQRSMKHRGGVSNSNSSVGSSGAGSGGASNQNSQAPPPPPPPLPPPFPVVQYMVRPVLEPRVRGPRPVGGVPSSQPGDQFSHRNHNRKGNFGARPRGDGSSYHNNHGGGRRDQDRRDVHLTPPQFVPSPGGFTPPQSPGSPGPFMPVPLRPFAAPVGYDMPPQFIYVPTPLPPETFRGMPIIPPPPPLPFFFPLVDPNLPGLLVKQIEYYFSDDNLVKDDFLRSKMDEEGWVPIELIANFPRVTRFTNNIQFIVDCLRASTLVEVQVDKLRRRDDWKKWIHTSGYLAADSGSHTPDGSTENVETSSLHKVSLDESGKDKSNDVDQQDVQVEAAVSGILEELTSQSKLFPEGNAEETCFSHAGNSQVC